MSDEWRSHGAPALTATERARPADDSMVMGLRYRVGSRAGRRDEPGGQESGRHPGARLGGVSMGEGGG